MMKILVVDDSTSIRKVVQARVQKMGFQLVGSAQDGEEGLALYKKHLPDLVLLDITMPNMDGRRCLKELKAINPQAKVIMLSAVSGEETIEECRKLGALAFVSKRDLFTSPDLENEIQAALGMQPAAVTA